MRLILPLLLILSFSAHAGTYICEVKDTNQTISFGFVKDLGQVCENEGMEEEEFCWDSASLFKLSIQTTELPFADHVEYGVALEEDVRFIYTSNSSDIRFGMYLDDNDDVYFTLNGKEMSFSNCLFYDFNQK